MLWDLKLFYHSSSIPEMKHVWGPIHVFWNSKPATIVVSCEMRKYILTRTFLLYMFISGP